MSPVTQWSNGETAYRYPFSSRDYDLPETRLARRGTEDLGAAGAAPARGWGAFPAPG